MANFVIAVPLPKILFALMYTFHAPVAILSDYGTEFWNLLSP